MQDLPVSTVQSRLECPYNIASSKNFPNPHPTASPQNFILISAHHIKPNEAATNSCVVKASKVQNTAGKAYRGLGSECIL